MNQFHKLSKWAWSLLVVCTLAFAVGGCDGKDGAPGPAGPAGPAGADGADGAPGEQGPPGSSATVTPLESCGVCHDDGSFASAPDYHALDPIEFVDNIVIAPAGDDLTVSFRLARDGVLTAGYDTIQRGYRTDGVDRIEIVDTLSALTDNGDGTYSFTIPGGNLVAGDNRYLFRVAMGEDRETRVYFYQDYPNAPEAPVAVTAQACTNCHGPEGIGVHGGYFQAEDGGEPCLVCHGKVGSRLYASLGMATHAFHSSIWEEDGEAVHITFPTYMNNCSVCHAEQAQLDVVNAMPVTGPGCFTCHGSMAGFDFTGLEFHEAYDETTDCSVCHNGGTARAAVADFHNGSTTERAGVIFNGVDAAVEEGKKFDWTITSVADDGTDVVITWQASYDGTAVDPCNDTVSAGNPVFHVPRGGSGGTFSMLRNYAQGEDFILGQSTSAPGQPTSVNLDDTNTICAGLVATTTIPADTVAATVGRVAIQGKPGVVNPADPAGLLRARVPTPTYDWVLGTSDMAPARRAIVDTGECVKCHVGSLYQHGGNRVDNVDMCILCHNSASNEKNVRVSTMGIDVPADTYDGRSGETYEIKSMLHRIHSAGLEGQPPIVIYRGRGVYAFAPDRSGLANWPGEGSQAVYGSTIDNDGNPGSYVTNHNFHAPTYPRAVNDCAACHVAGSVEFQPDQTKAMATTVDAGGTDDYADQTDDVLQGAATTACVTCHADGPAKGHAFQNSWEPQEFPDGRQTIIDAVN